MNRIHTIENFIDDMDIEEAIACIQKEKINNAFCSYQDNPDVMVVRDSNSNANAIIEKYSRRLIDVHKELSGYAAPLFTCQAQLCIWPTGVEAGPHLDSHRGFEFVTFSSVVYLNDDFEGGELFFPNHNVVITPKCGMAIFFPSGGKEYVHGVKKVTSGERYTLSMFHSPNSNATLASGYSRNLKRKNYLIDKLSSAIAILIGLLVVVWAGYPMIPTNAHWYVHLVWAFFAIVLSISFSVAFVTHLNRSLQKKHIALLALTLVLPPVALSLFYWFG